MTSPVDPEKAEELQPLLVDVSADASTGASDVPKVDNKRRFWFIVVYTLCLLFALRICIGSVGKLGMPGVSTVRPALHPQYH